MNRHPFERYRRLPYPVLLESGATYDADGERTIAAADPFAILTVCAGVATTRRRGQTATRRVTNGWDALRDFVAADASRAAITIGFVSYEAGLELERVRSRHINARVVPEFHFAAYDIFDEWPSAKPAGARASVVPRSSESGRNVGIPERVASNFDRAEYLAAIETILEYERAGDIYQANLSQRFDVPLSGDAFKLFAALQAMNPAPFAAFLETPRFAIACNSPERLLRGNLRTGDVESRPIKGTARDAKTLACSAKDHAEHLMIVDLVRSDLGRIAEPGSVSVDGFARPVAFPMLWHAISTVRARLRPGIGVIDALRAISPGGSVTGCPKIRAMEIIDQIERAPRGVYCGSIGYIKSTGEFDFNIAIRTAVVANGRATYSAGGAVVADSNPAAEYDETLLKSRAFFDALRVSGALGTKTDNRPESGAKVDHPR